MPALTYLPIIIISILSFIAGFTFKIGSESAVILGVAILAKLYASV